MNRIMSSDSDIDSETESLQFFSRARNARKNENRLNTFCWSNITVWRKKERESKHFWQKTVSTKKKILQNVNGFMSEGSLVAIMGPSGSGKTTLLAAISARIKEGVQGNIFVNGEILNDTQMRALSGFVPQFDLVYESLTVFQHMKLMAQLKMDRRTSEITRLKRIIKLMDELGITHCSSTRISQLSGGEKRRLSIAVQMLTNPLLLFCDEPTTGLDSASTMIVVKLLKKFTMEGKMVVCSIHQPSASVFELFDKVMLLASGGRVAYFGPVVETIDHFRKQNLLCPPTYNIAEFLINKISKTDSEAPERIAKICEHYKESKAAAIVEERIKAVCFETYLSSDRCSFFSEYKYDNQPLYEYYKHEQVTLKTQCSCLIQRSAINLRTNHLNHFTHIVTYMATAAVVSSVFAQTTLCSENSIQNIRGFINTIILETLYIFAYFEFNTFLEEKPLMLREVSSGLYSCEAYYVSKLLCKVFQSITEPVLFVFIVRNVSSVFNHLTFLEFVIPFIVVSVMSSAYGSMLSSVIDNFSILMVVATGHEISAYLLAGIIYKISSLPPILAAVKYFSIFYYSIEYVTVLEWSRIDDIRCDTTNEFLANGTRPLSPLEILADYGFDTVNYGDNLWILLFFAIIFHYVAYRSIYNKGKKQTPAY